MFSIIIPLYNKELSIGSTVQSVLDQNYDNFELVIVNDGSTDSSVASIQAFKDNRIRLIHQENQGVSTARNRGIKEAKYEWIAFLDADDLWKTNHLQTVLNMIAEYGGYKVFSTSFEYSDRRKTFLYERPSEVFIIEDYFKEALKEHHIWTGVIVINKSCFERAGHFNPLLSRGEDLDLWARLAKNYAIVKSLKVTATYRVEAENRACNNQSRYGSSIVSIIDLNGLKGTERLYYKNILFNRLKGNIRNVELKELFKIVFKHNFNLLK